MEMGSVGSMTSYLASPYMALCLLAMLGFYPFVCKASVVCVDCSGPGCEHPGSCETNGKCFLRRDVNGLLYRGCADNQRWEGLDLGYDGCKWQHYLGWDNTRVLWCLCHKPNCNSVTVGIFMLRDYSIHVPRPDSNNDQSSRDHQAFTRRPEADNGGSSQRGNATVYLRNHTHTHTHRVEEWSTDSESDNGDGKPQGGNGEFETESTQMRVNGNGDRGCNMSIIICRILGRDHTNDNRGSIDGSVTSSTVAPITSGKNNGKDSGSEEAQNRDPSPTPLDTASDRFMSEGESSDMRLSGNPDVLSDSQDDKRYEHASTTESTIHGTIPVSEKEDTFSLDDVRDDKRNQTSKDSGTATKGNDGSGGGNVYGARYDMDLDYEAEYAERMENNGEGGNTQQLGSPQDGGAKTNNKDYRWLVNTDGSEPYEPIGPIEGLDDLNSPLVEPLLDETASSEQESDSSATRRPQTGGTATVETSDIVEPLPDNLQTGDTGSDKWWGEGVRDGPVPLDKNNGDREGPLPLDNQDGVREGPQPLNNQEGSIPLEPEGGDREGPVPLNSQVPTVTSTSSDAQLSSSTRHPQEIHAECPSEFKLVPHLHSCYHVDRAPQTWQGAADHCKRLDPRAHLVTIDRQGEYQYIVLKIAMEPKLMRGWQGWWTSGRYNANIREFTWANTGHVISRLDPKWRHGLIVSPYSGTCVWFVPLAGFKIGNYGCQQPAGAICEIDL